MYITHMYIYIYIYISSDDDDDHYDHDHDDLYVFVSIMILIDSSDPPGETSALGSRLQIGVRRLATDRRWPELNGWTRGHFVDPSNKDSLWLFNIAMGNRWFTCLPINSMVIFHGELLNNQMVYVIVCSTMFVLACKPWLL